MTKTFTPTPSADSLVAQPADRTEQHDDLFYNSIKPQLNELIKEPSDEVINSILAFSKKK